MKSSKVLYSTLAASALLAAGFATVAHADDTVPASSTPETTAVTPAASSSAPEATTPASETPASTTPSTPASSSTTPAASESASTPSSASSTSASTPAASAETSASSAEAPKANEEITKTIAVGNMPVLKDGAKYHTTNGVILWEGEGDQIPPKTLEYTEESKKKSQYSNGDFSTVDEDGTVWTPVTDTTELSKGYGKYIRLENGQNKDGYVNNGIRIFLYSFDVPVDQGDLSTPHGTVDLKLEVLSEDEFSIQYAAPWLDEDEAIEVSYDLYDASNDESVIKKRGMLLGLPVVTKKHPYLEFWIAPNVNLPDGTYYFTVKTFKSNGTLEPGERLPYTGKSNTFTMKDGKFVVPPKEDQPTTPPTNPSTTPSTNPSTTPSTNPSTTPTKEGEQPASEEVGKETKPSDHQKGSKESKENQKESDKLSSDKGTSDKGAGNGREVYPVSNQVTKSTLNSQGTAKARNTKASLPNTGEKVSVFATVAGILVAGLAVFTFKRKEN